MKSASTPLLRGSHVAPPSVVSKVLAAEIAMCILDRFEGCGTMLSTIIPPAPGAQRSRVEYEVSAGTSAQVRPLSVLANSAAGSTPA